MLRSIDLGRWIGCAALVCLIISLSQAARSQAASVIVGEWSATHSFVGPRTSFAAAIHGNRVYVLGGLHAAGGRYTLYDEVQFATLGNDGSIAGTGWQSTASFSIPRSGVAAIVHHDTIYLVGGYDSGTLGDTQYAAIDEDGLLDTWKTSQNTLNFPRSNHALEVVTTVDGDVYLLAIGGVDTIDGDTVHYDYVEAAQILDNGSIGPWNTCLYHLKGGRSAPATFVHNGRLYASAAGVIC